MGERNFLVEGGSGTGKTTVCAELRRRGVDAVNGDVELAYQGDPETGVPVEGITGIAVHDHHIWAIDDVHALVADQTERMTFFCGGSRNFSTFIDLFDEVFILDADLETVNRRLGARSEEEWGGNAPERELIARLHRSGEGLPPRGIRIDATEPISQVVDEILRRAALLDPPVDTSRPR